MKTKHINKKRFIFLLVSIILVVVFAFYLNQKQEKPTPIIPLPRPTIDIFIHGSFGTPLGFLSIPHILKDDLKGSLYKKLIKRMRKDSLFYQDQPILQRGLTRVVPTFDIPFGDTKRLAAYPILKAYDLVSKEIDHSVDRKLYAFGWNGLVSQDQRRRESLRLYNTLSQELAKQYRDTKPPKIRLITHSHGGNIGLNLGGIFTILNLTQFPTDPIKNLSQDPDENESLAHMLEYIKTLPNREQTQAKKGFKRFDYVPEDKKLIIDELVLLGTPIQPETARFCLSPIFKNVYNIYSDHDSVQQLDFVSTRKGWSEKRFSDELIQETQRKKTPHLVQARILFDRHLKQAALTQQTKKLEKDGAISQEPSLWNLLFSNGSNSVDPLHKDLWFAGWWQEEKPKSPTLHPLPVVTILPIILNALKSLTPDIVDVDAHVKRTSQHFKIVITRHNEIKPLIIKRFPRSFIESIKNKALAWQPERPPQPTDIAMIYKYLINSQ